MKENERILIPYDWWPNEIWRYVAWRRCRRPRQSMTKPARRRSLFPTAGGLWISSDIKEWKWVMWWHFDFGLSSPKRLSRDGPYKVSWISRADINEISKCRGEANYLYECLIFRGIKLKRCDISSLFRWKYRGLYLRIGSKSILSRARQVIFFMKCVNKCACSQSSCAICLCQ